MSKLRHAVQFQFNYLVNLLRFLPAQLNIPNVYHRRSSYFDKFQCLKHSKTQSDKNGLNYIRFLNILLKNAKKVNIGTRTCC